MATNLQVVSAPQGVPQGPIPVVSQPQGVPQGPIPVMGRPSAPAPQNLPVVSQPANVPQLNPQVQSAPQNVPQVSGVTTADGQPIAPPPLAEPRRQQLDGIVQKMTADGQPQQNIQAVVADFKQKYGGEEQPQQQQGDNKDLNSVQNFGLGLVKGGIETAQGLDNLLGKITGVKANNVPVNTKTSGLAQGIGKGAEALLEFLAMPEAGVTEAVTKLGIESPKLAKVAELGAKGIKEGLTNTSLGQLHGSDSPKTDFAVGAASPIAGEVISKLWKAAPELIGKSTGISNDIVQQAVDNKPLFQQALKEVAAHPGVVAVIETNS